ncbi:MAG: fructosamine kinase family protein [Polyangia bacterium]
MTVAGSVQGSVWAAVGQVVGAEVTATRALTGGDINDAYAADLSDGREVFVKTSRDRHPPAEMFPTEARGLRWLAAAGALRTPEVIATDPRFLVLELIRAGTRAAAFDQDLGRGLAGLHQAGAPGFGLDHDNFIGPLAQSNRPAVSWAAFYAAARIEPQLRRAVDAGAMSVKGEQGLRRVLAKMDDLVGPAEPPARLHGDLWSGNLICDQEGAPCLIDPAAYGGHREVDLAMMRLFGGFSGSVFQAYEEVFPLAPGHRERVRLYQLYPLLVHVNLFGGAYLGSLESALAVLV